MGSIPPVPQFVEGSLRDQTAPYDGVTGQEGMPILYVQRKKKKKKS
jgi:hypothetical protein